MGLKDRFRIDELVKKGSKAIPRNKRGDIVVRKQDGKQRKITSPKPQKPYGEELIRGKQTVPKYKWEEIEPLEETNVNQESFSGETSGYIEVPKYDEDELKKAVDIKVDELIKPKKEKRGDFIPRKRFTDLQSQYNDAQKQIKNLTEDLQNEKAKVGSLEASVASLQTDNNSLTTQLEAKQLDLEVSLANYDKVLTDFQTSLIKGTKEGIERASLSAQAQGLQAQKETLQAQLVAQQDIVKSLQQQAVVQQQVQEQVVEAKEKEIEAAKQTSLLDIVGDRSQYQVKGTVAWAAGTSNKNIKPDWPVYWDDRKKGPKGVLSGMKFDFFNIGEEDVTLTVTEEVNKKGKWLTGVPKFVDIPKSPDGGSTPGQKTISFGRGSTGKGTYETTIKFKNATTGEELKMKTHYWQARRRRKT